MLMTFHHVALALTTSLLLPPTTTPLLPRTRLRIYSGPRCQFSIDEPMGGPLFDEATSASAAGGEGGEEGGVSATIVDTTAEVEYVRPPPEYPEDLHDAAKADRTGPFWSSLGEPDISTGVRPSYLRRDDWHISSTYTAEERAAAEARVLDAKAASVPAQKRSHARRRSSGSTIRSCRS